MVKSAVQIIDHSLKIDEPKGNSSWWMALIVLSVISFGTRLYKVHEPDHVCWDETHFGKMGSWYINRTFFFDVHPPVGKMLIALSGVMTGYNGSFPFEKPGDKYNDVNYVGMRKFCSILGGLLIPFTFISVWEMTYSLSAASLSSTLILFDVGTLTLTQYILLDPLLLFFMLSTLVGICKFRSLKLRDFSAMWWFWLIFTGITMACCVGVKFVGLFQVIFIGLMTIVDLWFTLGNLSKPISYTIKHFVARFICLIVLPILLYVGFFYIHLLVLNKSGNGDGFYSSAFQSKLQGNSLHNASMPKEVAFGSIVTLKNHRTGGGYLHSHWHLYPENVGAKQQQITTYAHKDENNRWLIKFYKDNEKINVNDTVRFVKHGDMIRLEHVPTRRNLHSHRESAPITKKHYQVTGYGEEGVGDYNDVWKVFIENGNEDTVISAVISKIKFVHVLQHCVLTASNKQLPKWAFEQLEVTCSPNLRDANSFWNVEDNINPNLPNVSFEVYSPNFFARFIESHAVMFQGNSGLKPKEGEITSRPWQWPINYKGQFFSGNNYKIYLLGNPVIWWANLAIMILYNLISICKATYDKRRNNQNVTNQDSKQKLLTTCNWLFIGWCLHYLPFYAMGRVLYYHHYFPAFLYSSMLTGVTMTYILETIKTSKPNLLQKTVYDVLIGIIYSSVIYSFYLYSPLAYGMAGPISTEKNSTMYGLRWLDSWEF
ncbi:MIR motif,Protein O-mannosyl-transferase, C-terminal four TM domain,Glycosyl transferase family 39/83 [Cinara cedri]|uniref:Protein O-mannosyl-transferase 2 n=1 Tax=Cinara cedri TaxID=506608 RepID=A0A5E4MNR5_9HEMI|nr:MIR motif,Protein O-mannosyl-transferase, C-terminal four TM domain,Glycosyl transferase family 39/83 [Cinara cedri]